DGTLNQALGADRVDLGGQWVGPYQRHLLGLIRELGLRTFPQHHEGRKVLEVQGERRTYAGKVPALPLLDLLDLQWNVWRLERWAKRVPKEHPPGIPEAAEWDAMTVADYRERFMRTPGARLALDIATRAIFAAEPEQLSLLHFLFYCHSGGGVMQLTEIEGGAQAERVEGGMGQVAERMAAELGERVVLDAPVRAVRQGDSHVVVESEGRRWEGQYAVMAVPPALAKEVDFSPALAPGRAAMHERMPMGSVIKCVAAYPRAFWREAGFSGEAVSDTGPVRLVFDDSSRDGAHPALVAFLLADTARAWTGRSAEERRAAVLAHLVRLFGPGAAHPSGYAELDWVAEPWSRGCYVGVMGPGVMTEVARALREPWGRVHWAGTETAVEQCGYIDGAVESGYRAAAEVQARMAAKARAG
ncbi:MAG: FAD-dependent oxidoreductase, partial [Myxococcaceae bacterium]|nr:FAD-dependent oxidoreductase [Myxococcaceae bacterium]